MTGPAREGRWSDDIVALSHEIDTDWVAIDKEWDRLRRRYDDLHLRRDSSRDSASFLLEALQITKGRNLLPAFAAGLMAAGVVTEKFDQLLMEIVGESAFTLQAFLKGAFAPTNALIAGKGLLDSCERVCRIDVDEVHCGTGVLVRPTLVATALHVVRELVEFDGASVHARAGTAEHLRLIFGYIEDFLPNSAGTGTLPGEEAKLHASWLAWGSKRTANEESRTLFNVRDVCGITKADGPWDLAIIRLAEPRRADRPTPLVTEPRRDPFQIHVLHHPGRHNNEGEPLLWSIGTLDKQLGEPEAVRYLHDANTAGGSSGAPVFDSRWRVVALHQAGELRVANASALSAEARNRAVPVCHWMRRLDQLEWDPGVVPYATTINGRDDKPHLVVGRRGTQDRLWQAIHPEASAAERLLIVRGEPGIGLHFTTLLASEFVRSRSDGLVGVLDVANALATDASGFARRIIGAFSGKSGALAPAGASTKQNEIRTAIAPNLGEQLEKIGGGRPVWLILEGFDRAKVSDQHGIDNLLLLLINQLGDRKALRLVMVAWQQTPPAGFTSSVEDLKAPTENDVATACMGPGEEPNAALIDAAKAVLDGMTALGLSGYAAAVKAAETLRAIRLQAQVGAQ